LEGLLTRQCQDAVRPLVVLDARDAVRGYAHPGLWELAETCTLHAFLTPRNGIAHALTLPAPSEGDAAAVCTLLLSGLSDSWHRQRTTGDLIRWPSFDPWLHAALHEQGFVLDSFCALHPPGPPRFGQRPPFPWLHIRPACLEDEAVLVALFEEEVALHAACVPCARVSSQAVRGFHEGLARLWAGLSLDEGGPMVLVAEQARQVVGMAEWRRLRVRADDEPGFTRAGHYGCIDNVSVKEGMRGQGIGRRLVQEVFAALVPLPLDGSLLWYNPDNALAAAFWSSLGCEPLWTTYQRLHHPRV
jgi:GNAT superfamily N-acetyltransferase